MNRSNIISKVSAYYLDNQDVTHFSVETTKHNNVGFNGKQSRIELCFQLVTQEGDEEKVTRIMTVSLDELNKLLSVNERWYLSGGYATDEKAPYKLFYRIMRS